MTEKNIWQSKTKLNPRTSEWRVCAVNRATVEAAGRQKQQQGRSCVLRCRESELRLVERSTGQHIATTTRSSVGAQPSVPATPCAAHWGYFVSEVQFLRWCPLRRLRSPLGGLRGKSKRILRSPPDAVSAVDHMSLGSDTQYKKKPWIRRDNH